MKIHDSKCGGSVDDRVSPIKEVIERTKADTADALILWASDGRTAKARGNRNVAAAVVTQSPMALGCQTQEQVAIMCGMHPATLSKLIADARVIVREMQAQAAPEVARSLDPWAFEDYERQPLPY